MRSLWKGTTEFWTSDIPQDDTWEPNRHHSHILPLFRSHLAPRHSQLCFLHFRILSTHMSMGAGILICLLCHTPRMPRKKEEAWYWCCQNYTVCTVVSTMTPLMAQNLDDKAEITEANKSTQRRLTSEEKKRRSSQNIEEQSAQNKVIPDSRLSAVSHTENAEEKGRHVVLEVSELSNVYSSHHHDPFSATESQDAAAVNDRIPAKGCRHLLVSGVISNEKGEIIGTRKSIQR